MKEAVVIHPRLTVYGGGEMVALHVIKALQELDYKVSIVTDNYSPVEVERNFRMGKVMENCKPIKIPPFRPVLSRFLALQRLPYASKVMDLLRGLKPDVAFSTQSVIYYIPGVKTFHIVYDMADLFEILPGGQARGPLASIWKKPYYMLLRRTLHTGLTTNRLFVPLSHTLEQQLSTLGYPHSSVVFPPCDMIFRPRPKKKQVCLVSRIAPQKNVEDFMKIAQRLPSYRFILVGIHADIDPGYSRKVLSFKPPNVEYIEARIRDRPELVEESKVYLYTSLEPGIGIALGQAMGAGCIPVTPAWGGGAEMVFESGVGHTYSTIEEAVQRVKDAVESNEPRDSPPHVAEKARVFSLERFDEKIANLVTKGSDDCAKLNFS